MHLVAETAGGRGDLSPLATVCAGIAILGILVVQVWWVRTHPLDADTTPAERTGRVTHIISMAIGSLVVVPIGVLGIVTGLARLW